MKIKIDNIYNDGLSLFAQNPYLYSDARLTSITSLVDDLDLIAQFSYGAREFFKKYLKEDNDHVYIYDFDKIRLGIYACIVENLPKYDYMLAADEYAKNINPLEQFKRQTVYGAKQQTNAYGATSGQTNYGKRERNDTIASRTDTTTHGTKTTQDSIGSVLDTSTSGAREVKDAVVSFSSGTYADTNKSNTASVIDTVQSGAHTDTRTETQLDDTITYGGHADKFEEEAKTDVTTKAAHSDTLTTATHTDIVTGYNDGMESVEKYRSYARNNTVKEIVNDCVNAITYAMYLF